MANMDEKMTCEVVQDLLPLYVDGVCTQGTQQLVEEHLAACPACKKRVEEMTAPIEALCVLDVAEAPSDADQAVKAGLKKMRRSSKQIIVGCIAGVILILLCLLLYFESTGRNLCLSNYDEYLTTKNVVDLWVSEGSEAAVEAMTPTKLYESALEPMTDYEFLQSYSILPNTVNTYDVKTASFDGSEYSYIGGKAWYEIYNEAQELDELHDLVIANPYSVILTSKDRYALHEAYGDLDMENYHSFRWGDVTYYYYYDQPVISYDDDSWMYVQLSYPAGFEEVLGDLEAIPKEYCLLRQIPVRWMPRALWEGLCLPTYQTIRENFYAFEQHYADMGAQAYIEKYRNQVAAALKKLEAAGVQVESAQMISIGSSTYLGDVHSYHVTWLLRAGDARLIAGFYSQGGECHLVSLECYGVMSQQLDEALSELRDTLTFEAKY